MNNKQNINKYWLELGNTIAEKYPGLFDVFKQKMGGSRKQHWKYLIAGGSIKFDKYSDNTKEDLSQEYSYKSHQDDQLDLLEFGYSFAENLPELFNLYKSRFKNSESPVWRAVLLGGSCYFDEQVRLSKELELIKENLNYTKQLDITDEDVARIRTLDEMPGRIKRDLNKDQGLEL